MTLGPSGMASHSPDTPVEGASVVCLTHPSLRGPNVGRRRYRGLAGDAAEHEMIADAVAASGVDLRVANGC